MTEEQKARRKEYMKQYSIEHREQVNKNRKKWYNNHKEQQYELNRKIYQRQKENGGTWQQRHKDDVNEYNRNYRKRKVEELRSQGIINAWSVFLYNKEPKYEDS